MESTHNVHAAPTGLGIHVSPICYNMALPRELVRRSETGRQYKRI
jgi:hypothetical protein